MTTIEYITDRGISTENYPSQRLEFDEYGYIKEEEYESTKSVFAYDEYNKKMKVDLYDHGKLARTIKYKYNQDNKLIEISIDTHGEHIKRQLINYEYDGGIISKKTIRNDDGYDARTEKYDKEGNVVEFEGLGEHYLLKYNKNKYLIERIRIDKSGIAVNTEKFDPGEKKKMLLSTLDIDPAAPNYKFFQLLNQKGKCGTESTEIFDDPDNPNGETEPKAVKMRKKCDKQENWIKLEWPR